MTVLLGLLPALAWGFLPLAVSKIGGNAKNQILGTTAGALAVGLVVWLIRQPPISGRVFLLGLASGAAWVVGQAGQFTSYGRIGVSKTMPVSTGLQMVGTSLVGVTIFGEWPGVRNKVVGAVALAVVVGGILLTTVQHPRQKTAGGGAKAALLILFFTNFGYLVYSALPDLVQSGGTAVFLPQTVGMFCAAAIYVLATKQAVAFRQPASYKNLLAGALFSVGALTYIISADANGIATAFTLAQLSVVISTLGGIFLLKEHKNRFELVATAVGLVLIVAGGAVTAFL